MSILSVAVSEVIDRKSFDEKINSDRSLRVKLGVDPSSPNLHLGHYVLIKQLERFIEAGHKVIFLVGDFTATIGDPSGRNKERPILSLAQIKANLKTYIDQVSLVIDTKKIEIRYNSEWYEEMTFGDWLRITERFTANQILERDDFEKRLNENRSLGIHEMMYPIMQAYDSVMLKADVEIGGTDQRFNMLSGRVLQKKMDMPSQDVVMMQLLVGTDGKKKMSKSVGNTIELTDSPEDIFGKVMSIPDETVAQYAKLVLGKTIYDLSKLSGSDHPKAIKEQLAYGIVELLSPGSGQQARDHFQRIHNDKQAPDNISGQRIDKDESIKSCLLRIGVVPSSSELQRLVRQNAVKINGKIVDWQDLSAHPTSETIVKVGKLRFIKIIQ